MLIRAWSTSAGQPFPTPSHLEGAGLINQGPTFDYLISLRVIRHNGKRKQYFSLIKNAQIKGNGFESLRCVFLPSHTLHCPTEVFAAVMIGI